ncbi:hypothetical protein ACJMK2_026569 [Sinanodonta woodiana]|uniref:Uncharacterized protein n=1 Tax=Sinanodonta woodiana TaxID=1069815 RepID=A0ABD3XNQ8_SINWO
MTKKAINKIIHIEHAKPQKSQLEEELITKFSSRIISTEISLQSIMKVTVFILAAVLALHISCIYCHPTEQPSDHTSAESGETSEQPENENELTHPPHPNEKAKQTHPPHPHQDSRPTGSPRQHVETRSHGPNNETHHTRPPHPTKRSSKKKSHTLSAIQQEDDDLIRPSAVVEQI